MSTYGRELVMDIRDADPSRFTRAVIQKFMATVCERLDLEPCDLHFWDYQTDEEREAAPTEIL